MDLVTATKQRVHCDALINRITTAEAAAELFQEGMNVGVSGFTPQGYPKAVPLALAERAKHTPLQVNIWSGASVGEELDEELTKAGVIARRLPYQTGKHIRNAINTGKIAYTDIHLSHVQQMARYGFLTNHRDVDIAVIEACAIKDLGHGQVGIIPTTSLGCSTSWVQSAKQVIVEINVTQPVELEGMHDCYVPLDPPHRKAIAILQPADLIGKPYIVCEAEKLVAIVPCDIPDPGSPMKPLDEDSRKMGAFLVDFLQQEVRAGRQPKNLLPLQSGVGSVSNAVLAGLLDSDFTDLEVYSEVIQDGMFALLDAGKLKVASGVAIAPSPEGLAKFYTHIADYKKKIILRPQEIANNPEVIRRLGVIAMNTAIEVDIYGNVNSTHVLGTKMMNGIGGSGDYARNGYLTIFCTASIAKEGKISSVVPFCSHIDHTEHDVDVIISEQGVADLRDLSPKERALCIINNVAHPSYRPLLLDYFERACAKCNNSQTPHLLGEAFSFHERLANTGTMQRAVAEGEED